MSPAKAEKQTTSRPVHCAALQDNAADSVAYLLRLAEQEVEMRVVLHRLLQQKHKLVSRPKIPPVRGARIDGWVRNSARSSTGLLTPALLKVSEHLLGAVTDVWWLWWMVACF